MLHARVRLHSDATVTCASRRPYEWPCRYGQARVHEDVNTLSSRAGLVHRTRGHVLLSPVNKLQHVVREVLKFVPATSFPALILVSCTHAETRAANTEQMDFKHERWQSFEPMIVNIDVDVLCRRLGHAVGFFAISRPI